MFGPDGRPLDGFVAFGLKPGWDRPPSSSAGFALTVLAPFELRRLVFRHDDRKLIGTLVVLATGTAISQSARTDGRASPAASSPRTGKPHRISRSSSTTTPIQSTPWAGQPADLSV